MADFAVNIVLKARDEATATVRRLIGETKKIRNVRGGMGGGMAGPGFGGQQVNIGMGGAGRGRSRRRSPEDGGFDFDGHRIAAHLAGASYAVDKFTNKVKTGLMAPLELAANFEQAMTEVRAVTGDAQIDGNFDKLAAKARQLGRDTEFTATQAAEGLKYMGIAGWSSAQQIATLPPMLDAATISGLELGRTSDIITDVMGGFGMQAGTMINGVDAATYAVDSMVATTLNANTNLDQLAMGMFKVGPLAKKVGVEFNEVTSMLGVLANAGIKGSEGGTAMRNILLSLTGKPSKDMRELLKHLGLDSAKLRDELGKNGIAGAMGLLMEQVQHLDEPMQLFAANVLFGRRTAVSAVNILDKLGAEYVTLKGKVDASGGAAAKAAGEFRSTAKASAKTLTSALEELGIEIGDQLLPVMLPLLEDARAAAKAFAEWAKENPELVRTLGKIAIAVVGIGTVLGPVLLGASAITSTVLLGKMAAAAFGAKAVGAAAAGAGADAAAASVGVKTLTTSFAALGGVVAAALAAVAAGWVIIDVTQNKIEKLNKSTADMAKQNVKANASAAKVMQDEQIDDRIALLQKRIIKTQTDIEQKPQGMLESIMNRGVDQRHGMVQGMQRQMLDLLAEKNAREAGTAPRPEKWPEIIAPLADLGDAPFWMDDPRNQPQAPGPWADPASAPKMEIEISLDDNRKATARVKNAPEGMPVAFTRGLIPAGL